MNTIAARPAGQFGHVRLADFRRRSLLTAKTRTYLVALGFLLVALAALMRIAWLGVVQPAPAQRSMSEALLPPRGEITDRNGVPLARAFRTYSLRFNPEALEGGGAPLIKPADQVVRELKAIFPDLDEAKALRRLESGEAGILHRQVLPEEAEKVYSIGELALEFPPVDDRYYPQGSMAAHVLGYIDSTGKGRLGMESVLDDALTDPATRGSPSALSIDVRVQGALEDELRRGMLAVRSRAAAGIVLDVDTGEVMAMASFPEFDPNNVKSSDVSVSDAQAARKEMPPSFNRVTNEVYELGSTFKPLTVAGAIDAGTVTDLSRRYQADRPLVIGRYRIGDSHDNGEFLNVAESLIVSSNIVTGQIADELGAARLKQLMIDLGMNERPYIELPARGYPIWEKARWSRVKGMTVGFGHGISVTPLHLASAYAAMVNGGIWRPATLHKLESGMAPRGRRVFKASTSARMNQLLRMIAVYGTGRKADAPGFRVGGKTGSAEKPGVGGYQRNKLVTSFAAAFPMDKPRYVVIAVLDEPKATAASSYQRTAAWNAAPIVGALIPRIGPLLGVTPDNSRDIDLSDLRPLVEEVEP